MHHLHSNYSQLPPLVIVNAQVKHYHSRPFRILPHSIAIVSLHTSLRSRPDVRQTLVNARWQEFEMTDCGHCRLGPEKIGFVSEDSG